MTAGMSLPGSPFATLPPSVPTYRTCGSAISSDVSREDRNFGREQVGGDDLVLRRHRADDDVAAVGTDAFEVADVGEVDQMLRRREPELHHRDQAMPAGQRPRLLAEIGKQGHCFADGLRTMVVEGTRYHGRPPARAPTGTSCPGAGASRLKR